MMRGKRLALCCLILYNSTEDRFYSLYVGGAYKSLAHKQHSGKMRYLLKLFFLREMNKLEERSDRFQRVANTEISKEDVRRRRCVRHSTLPFASKTAICL